MGANGREVTLVTRLVVMICRRLLNSDQTLLEKAIWNRMLGYVKSLSVIRGLYKACVARLQCRFIRKPRGWHDHLHCCIHREGVGILESFFLEVDLMCVHGTQARLHVRLQDPRLWNAAIYACITD